MQRITRRTMLAASAAFAVAPALAQSSKMTLVVPFPPGGSTDALARLLQANLQTKLGRIVLVENKSGAAGDRGNQQCGSARFDHGRFSQDNSLDCGDAICTHCRHYRPACHPVTEPISRTGCKFLFWPVTGGTRARGEAASSNGAEAWWRFTAPMEMGREPAGCEVAALRRLAIMRPLWYGAFKHPCLTAGSSVP